MIGLPSIAIAALLSFPHAGDPRLMQAAQPGQPSDRGESADALSGASTTVAAPLPKAIRDEDSAYLTFRQGKVFGYRLAVANGTYDVDLAFLELVWRRPGQRVFDVAVNGVESLEGFDPVTEAGPAPSRVVKTVRTEVRDGLLRVQFVAASDQAAIAFLRVRDAATGTEVRFVDCGGDDDVDPASADAKLSEQILPRFGSRALLDLRPQWGDAEIAARGKFTSAAQSLILGFETGGTTYALPLARTMRNVKPFDEVSESRTVSRLRYDVAFGAYEGAVTIVAPFHPGDLVASALPVFRFEIALRRRTGGNGGDGASGAEAIAAPSASPVTVRLSLPVLQNDGGKPPRPFRVGDRRGIVATERTPDGVIERAILLDVPSSASTPGPNPPGSHPSVRLNAGPRMIQLSIPIDPAAGEARVVLHVALRSTRPVAKLGAEALYARGAMRDAPIEALFAAVLASEAEVDRASTVVDGLVEDMVVPDSLKALLRVALPSFLMNTCDLESATGERFYSCIEGFCRYHATLDVEAHAVAFYSWFGPELLRIELARSATCVTDDVICHDLGKDEVVGAQLYPHAMPIEENTNFVLLLHEYWTMTGDTEFVAAHAPLVARLLARVRACDADHDGFAETGVANTIDDATAAVQYARGQVYLAVKTAAAHLAGAEIAATTPSTQSTAGADAAREAEVAICKQYAKTIQDGLEAKAWRGTHYALTIDPSAVGLVNPWTTGNGAPIPQAVPVEVAGAETVDEILTDADSAHGLAALGAVHAFRTFGESPVPLERLRVDLETAADRTRRRFVLAHAESEVSGWVSLSLLRDATRAYLGDDALAHVDRYAALQSRRNRQDDLADWAGFCDSPYNRYLSYYPRGVAALALVDALAGLRVDRRTGRVALAPIRAPLTVPLTAFADWKTLRVPWLVVTRDANGKASATIRESDLLDAYDLELDLHWLGGDKVIAKRKQ